MKILLGLLELIRRSADTYHADTKYAVDDK